MDMMTIAIIVLGSVILIIIGIPVAYVLGFCAVVGLLLGVGSLTLSRLGFIPFTAFHAYNWIPLPLFVLMACIIGETAIGADIFDAANKWTSRIPGGLALTSLCAEAVMAATMGMSGTTVLTVGKVSMPQMERFNYNRRLAIGSILVGGVLGPLIPPSIPLVIYGIIARQSISELFMAGVIPGIILLIMLSAYIMVTCTRHPEFAPRLPAVSWKERIVSLWKVWPVLALILGIIGGIYLGVVTASEAAGIGVFIILLISIVFYRFRLAHLNRAMSEAITLTAMIVLMTIATTSFAYLVGISGTMHRLASFITASGISPWIVVLAVNVFLLFLGCIMDALAIMLLTIPLLVPLITHLGFDPIWFGVVMTVNIEIALLTPPVGLNMFMMGTAFRIPVSEVIRSMVPFLAILIIFLGIIIAFPQLSLWLPSMMGGG
jgi:C4-dicarboxylate transporter DctM subunit